MFAVSNHTLRLVISECGELINDRVAVNCYHSVPNSSGASWIYSIQELGDLWSVKRELNLFISGFTVTNRVRELVTFRRTVRVTMISDSSATQKTMTMTAT